MTKDPLKLSDSRAGEGAQSAKKSGTFRKFLGLSKPKDKTSKQHSDHLLLFGQTTQSPTVASLAINSTSTLPPSTIVQTRKRIFTEDISRPGIRAVIPRFQDRIEKTEQLVYCNILLLQHSSSQSTPSTSEKLTPTIGNDQQGLDLIKAEREWLVEMDKDPMEQEQLRWLVTRMVEEYVLDSIKDSIKIAEVVALGPVLDREHYRKLLSSIIGGFEDARILDIELLQGLVQLVQANSTGYLLSDDLVKILRILRIRLEGTHQQTTQHSFHLTLAVSRVLDVMADHKVEGLDRVLEHEPLSGVLSGLTGSSDPYLIYQGCYAFQALHYVPDDETALQAILRHSKGVSSGLVKISGLMKLDVDAVVEGLEDLQEVLGGAFGIAKSAYEGACSAMESGRSIMESLQDGYGSGSGKKRPWYVAIRAAYALVQAGQLRDLNRLIYEAPCRRDPLFQWDVCQLLGEIASDTIWDSTIRQQAVDFLAELYKNDPEWDQDENVKMWMLSIINQLSAIDDNAVSAKAHTLLKELKEDQNCSDSLPYPLRNRLPLPASSSLLTRVLAIPDVEYDLHKLRLQRLEEHRRGVYIPPQAKPSLQASNNVLFPLMEKVQEFLVGHRKVFLVLGDSGAGKSTFNLELENILWKGYKKHGLIPLYINLPTIDDPAHDLIEKQLQYHNFSNEQIQEMKQHRQFVIICDGYDESQLKINLYTTNEFNQTMSWKVKMVVSCRSQYLRGVQF
ncbi:MAG: hypothetical protein J3R72DRAFT_262267 [Linnemannia gamsii]|nr:MAG: hypothetical protein J3R72DRAFT_262267 [Linnemannia gamsii]